MEISEDLKERALLEWSYCMGDMPEVKNSAGVERVQFPFLFDGVLDRVDYNVKEKRFDKLHLRIAKSGIVPALFRPDVAYADEVETVTIDIPEDLKPQERPKYKKVW